MPMELTERYLKIVQKAAAKANYLHKVYGSWKKVSEKVGGVSHDTWHRIANGSPASSPRIETLSKIAFASSNDRTIPKQYGFHKDLERLKNICRRMLRSLAKAHGKDRLAEMLRVEPYKLHRWLSTEIVYTPEFRYLLAIDSLSVYI